MDMKYQEMVSEEVERLLDTAKYSPWSAEHVSEALSEAIHHDYVQIGQLASSGQFSVLGARVRHITFNYWHDKAVIQAVKNIGRVMAFEYEYVPGE